MKRVKKGNYGYLASEKRFSVIRTALLFALPLAVYLVGYLTTGDNKNLLTIVAVLGCLPACKSAVNMIMFLKARGCSGELKNRLEACTGALTAAYDLQLTSYEKTYAICHMVFRGKTVCGFTDDPKCDPAGCEKHLEAMFQQNGYKNLTVKIFTELPKYCERLEQLNRLGGESPGEEPDPGDGNLKHLALTVTL